MRQAVFDSDVQEDLFSVEDPADLEDAIRGRHTRHVYLNKLRAISRKTKQEVEHDSCPTGQKPEELVTGTEQDKLGDETAFEQAIEGTGTQDTEQTPEPLDEKTH
jgi:hypothetical protein